MGRITGWDSRPHPTYMQSQDLMIGNRAGGYLAGKNTKLTSGSTAVALAFSPTEPYIGLHILYA